MIWVAAVLLVANLLGRRLSGARPAWLGDLLPGGPLTPAPRRPRDRLWDALGALAAGLAFAYLQWLEPYYFAQGDALAVEMPGMLVGLRGVWAGHFPEVNPFVLGGAVLASAGLWSLTYPPTYLADALCRGVLGDEFALLDVFAALHLAAGYGLTRRLGERLGLSAPVAVLAALSFALCGPILILGRMWHTVVPLWVWLPALGLCVARLARGPVGWGWAATVGLCGAGLWHAGFPQYAVHAAGFFALACGVVWAGGAVPARRLLWLLPAALVAASLAAPLAWCQWELARGVAREPLAGFASSTGSLLATLVLPYPLAAANHPVASGRLPPESIGAAHYCGPLAALCLARLLAVAALAGRAGRGALPATACAAAGLWLALGDTGGLWTLLGYAPVVGRLSRWPLRVMPFVALPVILAGADVLERLARRRPGRALALGIGTAGLLAVHLSACGASLYHFGFRPYPEPPADWALGAIRPDSGRVMNWARRFNPTPDYWRGLPRMLPGVYGYAAFHGTDPVTEGLPPYATALAALSDPAISTEAARAYGLRWHAVHVSALEPQLGPNPGTHASERVFDREPAFRALRPDRLPCVGQDGAVSLRELSGCDPLAFARAQPGRPLPVSLHAGGVDADVSGLPAGSGVVLNFLRYPGTSVALDGGALAAGSDGWGRVAVTLPAAGSRLAMRHRAPWGPGLALGGGLLLAALLTAGALRRAAVTPGATPAPGS